MTLDEVVVYVGVDSKALRVDWLAGMTLGFGALVLARVDIIPVSINTTVLVVEYLNRAMRTRT